MTDTAQIGSPKDPAKDAAGAAGVAIAAPALPGSSQDTGNPAADTAEAKPAAAAAAPAAMPKVGPPVNKEPASGELKNKKEEAPGESKGKKEDAPGELKNKKERVSGESKNKKEEASGDLKNNKEPASGELKNDKLAESGRGPLEPGQAVERERLIYRPVERGGERQRRPRPNERADHFKFLKLRLEEIVARDEEEPVVILGVRQEGGLPHEALPAMLPGRLFVRSDQSGWGALKRSSFNDLRASFADAARDEAGAVFLDWVPYTEKSGDLARLIDGAYDERTDEFEAWLKEKGFHLFLVLAIDRPIDTTTVLNLNPRIRLLPWTDLWLSAFADAQSLPPNALHARFGEALRRAGKWDGSDDDNREKVLSFELQKLTRDNNCSELTAALAAIGKALEQAEGEMSDVSFKSARKDLAHYLGVSERVSGRAEPTDPITQVMLVVAAFAGGTRVEEYYAVCRELLPPGPAETLRLPLAVQEIVLRDAADAERMNRERAPLPEWDVVFDAERDAALSRLQIRVVEGQEIQIGSKWRIIDLKREITREYPGLIHSLIQRMCDRRLLVRLSEAEAALLLRVICAIRDACEEGFNDQVLASALTGAQHGLSDLGAPLDIVAELFPGRDPEKVLELLDNIQRHRRLAQSLDAIGKPDPELLQYLHALEELDSDVTLENFQHRYEQLRERSVQRLTRHILRMRASSSAASENRRPIIASMLNNLETILQTETYVSMLTYMLATGSEIDPLAIGKLLQREVARANSAELGGIITALRKRIGVAISWANVPHKNWLIAFDPVRAGMASDDRIRAVAVMIWDLAISEDVRWRIMSYERMKHLRLVCRLFARPAGIVDQNVEGDVLVDSQVPDEALIGRVATGFFAQDPADWLAALAALDEVQAHLSLQTTVMNRIGDVVRVIISGAAESECECAVLQSAADRLASELLADLTKALKLGPETDLWAAASRVIRAHQSPTDRFSRRWLPLYGLFWPAVLAHWRFTAFGLEPFQPGSDNDKCFRLLLDRIVAAAPQRSASYRDGFAALASVADKCAAHATKLRATASAELYSLKADRLRGLQAFFDAHATKSLIAV